MRRLAETDKASLRGIAFLAGSSGLLWNSLEEACATLKTDEVFEPRMSDSERENRRAIWHARVADELAHAKQYTRQELTEKVA